MRQLSLQPIQQKNGGGITVWQSGAYKDATASANGCDSVFILHLTINDSEVGTTEYATICYGESYTWNGNTYSASDTYTITLTNQQGCDSTATLVLTILPESVTQIENAIIGSDKLPYIWRGQTLNATGQYTDIEQYVAAACDSAIHVLNLTVLSTGATDEQTATICDTELPYHWYNEKYTTTGKYTYTEKYAGTDIDSIQHILNLTVNSTIRTGETVTACDSYDWNGQTYDQTGDYNYTTTAANGCDSIVTLHLTINYRDTAFFTKTACDSYEWHDTIYKESGTYYYHTQTVHGCDSVEVLHLTVLPPTEYISNDTLLCHGTTCEWRNFQLTTAGTYNDTIRNQLHCDSLIYILNLEYLPNVVYSKEDTLLCHGVTCAWRGLEFESAGTYNDTVKNQLDCDSLIYILNLEYLPDVVYAEEDTLLCHSETCHWRNLQLTTAGTYNDTVKNQLDCDSLIYTLQLAYLPDVQHFTTDTFLCYGEICDWRGLTYAESGTYHDTIRNILHCDSIIHTLNLVIYPEIPITQVVDTMAGVQYIWNEQIYTSGGDYYLTLPSLLTGCDSVVTLHLVDNPAAIDTIIMYEQCAGSGEQEVEILMQGYMEKIELRYSPKAQAAGLRDTVMPISSTNLYTIHFNDVRAGVHEATAVGWFHNTEVATYNFALTYLYPNTIFEQRYNDLIAVSTHDYNGGYDFTAFQWYKDGVMLHGETHSYLNQSLSFKSEYSVLLTDTNGMELMSCPIIAKDKSELSVYPTKLKQGESVRVRMTDKNTLYIYDSTGKIIHEDTLEEGTTQISMPIVSGIYLLRFVANDHIERTFRVIVQ